MSRLPKEIPESNPEMTRNPSGTANNHSSTTPSLTSGPMADHPQFDDVIVNYDGPPVNPNISGASPTEDTYTWLAGGMDAWRENDDYRTFFEQSEGPDSRLVYMAHAKHDGDYDDNRGVAIAIGYDYGWHDEAPSETVTLPEADEFTVEAAQRRI